MKRDWSSQELSADWTLAPDERLLIATKTGPTSLGFVVLLKFFQIEGRFPYYPQEVPQTAIEHVARQTGWAVADWWRYDWKGRTIKTHRAEIRARLGFREATVADGEALVTWSQEHYLDQERNPERVKAAALARFRELRIEPPGCNQPWFTHQHDVEFEPAATPYGPGVGVLSLFDNGNTRRASDSTANSRGQAVLVNETNMTADLVLNVDLGVYAAGFGSAQRLANGNYHFLAGYLTAGSVAPYSRNFEINPTDLTQKYVFTAGAATYRSFRLNTIRGN